MSRMMSESLIANGALFASLSDSAREEIETTLRDIASDVLAIQKRAVPVYRGAPRKDVDPGLLKRSLSIAESVSFLRVRVGLPQLDGRKSRNDLFYAIIQHYGRQAKTVQVLRGDNRQRGRWRIRMRDGKVLAYRPHAPVAYELPVRAMPGRPFVHVESLAEAAIERRLTSFWDRVIGKVGG